MDEIRVENAGPINGHFSIELDGPGLYELRGSKGVGKTTVLNAIELLAGHKTTITVNDNADKATVSGFGVVAPIASRSRVKGELEVNALDSEKFDILDLIAPQGKTPVTRDANRIRALAGLTNLQLELGQFSQLLEGVTRQVNATDDPVLLCSRVKGVLEDEARGHEALADNIRGQVEAKREQFKHLDLEAPDNADQLSRACEQAAAEVSQLEQKKRDAEEKIEKAGIAQAELDELRKDSDAPDVKQLQKTLGSMESQVKEAGRERAELQKQIAQLDFEIAETEREISSQRRLIQSAIDAEAAISGWKQMIEDGAKAQPPTAEQLEHAGQRLAQARAAQEQGVLIRQGKAAKLEASELTASANRESKRADELRSRAQAVFTQLVSSLQLSCLRIQSDENGQPRLTAKHPVRGWTNFDSTDGLSDGERVQCAIMELLPRVKQPGLFPIPQRTYQDLPPQDRQNLAVFAKANQLFLFGGQVDDSELRVVKISPEQSPS